MSAGKEGRGAEGGLAASVRDAEGRDVEGRAVGDRAEEGRLADERAAAGWSSCACDAETQVEGPREGIFEFRGLHFHYLVWGPRNCEAARAEAGIDPAGAPAPLTAGAPVSVPLVLLHGFAQSAASWAQAASLLARGRAVYALDLTGHGGSDRPGSPEPYRLSAQGEALLAFLENVVKSGGEAADAARSARRPVVVGYSMGGRVALAALVRAPEVFANCVGGLVLESAGLGPASAEERARAARADAERAAHLREAGVEAFMEEWERLPLFASQERLSPDVRARVRQERLANDAEALARTIEGAGQHAMPSREQTLAALEGLAAAGVPVLYLAGSLDAKYCALAESLSAPDAGEPKAAAHLAPGAPDIEARTVEGAGHNIHLEAPEAFCEVVAAFFSNVADDSIGMRDRGQVAG